MRIYYGGPMISKTNRLNKIVKEERREIEGIVSFVRKQGHEIFSPAETQRFIYKRANADLVTGREFEYLKYCDLVMIKPNDPPSGGAHVQLGWASAFRKPIIILTEGSKRYSKLVRGLEAVTSCTYIDITKKDKFQKLEEALSKSKKIIEGDKDGKKGKNTS